MGISKGTFSTSEVRMQFPNAANPINFSLIITLVLAHFKQYKYLLSCYHYREDRVKLNPSVASSWIYYTLKYNGSSVNVEISNTAVIPLRNYNYDRDPVLVPDQPVIYFCQLRSQEGARGDFELDELLVSTQ